MRVALAQVVTGRDLAGNLALVEDYARQARAGGAELVVFPEAAMRAFGNSLLDIAQPLDGPWASRVRAIAAELGIVIVAGMFTPGTASDGGGVRKVRNTLLVTGPGVETSYDKIHLFDAFGFAESDTVAAGSEPVTFGLGGMTFGLATCYDIRFPEQFRLLLDAGAQLFVVPAAWPAARVEHWRLLGRARALENQCYMVQCNTAGTHAGVEMGGRSQVVDPWGAVLAEAGTAEEVLSVEIDPESVATTRETFPVLADRRL